VTGFTLHLQATTRYERIDEVSSLVAEDASGRFGILAGHERLITTLVPGLAKFRTVERAAWQYLALPGSVLYFVADELFINTRRYLRGDDYGTLSSALEAELLAEEQELAQVRLSVHRMEEEILKRLWRMRRGAHDPERS
jgi:F-type H+-transporting ATPase subunit epsilon